MSPPDSSAAKSMRTPLGRVRNLLKGKPCTKGGASS